MNNLCGRLCHQPFDGQINPAEFGNVIMKGFACNCDLTETINRQLDRTCNCPRRVFKLVVDTACQSDINSDRGRRTFLTYLCRLAPGRIATQQNAATTRQRLIRLGAARELSLPLDQTLASSPGTFLSTHNASFHRTASFGIVIRLACHYRPMARADSQERSWRSPPSSIF